jgi:hypothetical protein
MSIVAFAVAVLLSGSRVEAQGPRSAEFSPDKRFVAITVQGEADCSYLYVARVGPRATRGNLALLVKQAARHASGSPGIREPRLTILHRMDVETFLWIPGKPHSLVFGESSIYGYGLVCLFIPGKKPKTTAEPHASDFQIFLKTYDPNNHQLSYDVTAYDRDRTSTKRHTITLTSQ